MQTLNLFYEEPDHDRWFKYDRYIRQLIRRIIRGKPRPGGQMMVALELMRGLDLLNLPYRFNDYNYARKHPNELIGVIGKSHLFAEKHFKNPILFGASIFSHPSQEPDLINKYPNIKQILVPGDWMKKMFEPFYGNIVKSWPVGIDTRKWSPAIKKEIKYDFLIYDKIRWKHNLFEENLINPIKTILDQNNLSYTSIVYGQYNHQQLLEKIATSKAVIFLCEHETQGLAYQQILATNTPILAYDQEEFWLDPAFYPHQVKYGPVSSVPYWDDRCGLKFNTITAFGTVLASFQDNLIQGNFSPRNYILENLSLESCALAYRDIYLELSHQLAN
jgi:glycosyltransferase involved in cell wall biosynthesis